MTVVTYVNFVSIEICDPHDFRGSYDFCDYHYYRDYHDYRDYRKSHDSCYFCDCNKSDNLSIRKSVILDLYFRPNLKHYNNIIRY